MRNPRQQNSDDMIVDMEERERSIPHPIARTIQRENEFIIYKSNTDRLDEPQRSPLSQVIGI